MKAAIALALSKLRKQPQHRPSVVQSKLPVAPGATSIPVLVASERPEDRRRVRAALENGPWLIVEASNWNAALSLSQCLIFPVIVWDRDLRGPDGRTTVQDVARGFRSASVVILSDRWDPDLWESLLHHGGFDVLMRPLHEDDILAVLDAAHRFWVEAAGKSRIPHLLTRD